MEFGRDFDEAKHEAFRVAAAEGLHFVPSFHKDLVVGVATYALELFRSRGKLDAVYVGVGMGSGVCGLIAVRDLLGLSTEIVAVGSVNAPASALSFAAGQAVNAPSALTFADGLATGEPNAQAIAMLCRGVSRFVQVSEDAIAETIRIYFDDAHQVAEGAGAAPLAALLQDRQQMMNKNVAVVFSCGNIERARYLQVLRGETPAAISPQGAWDPFQMPARAPSRRKVPRNAGPHKYVRAEFDDPVSPTSRSPCHVHREKSRRATPSAA